MVGQIAKIMGCNVIGTAGSDEKIKFILDELGFDYGINYKSDDIYESLDKFCPDGIDIYFDNVGGELTDAVMERLRVGARISVCGQISQYNNSQLQLGPRNIGSLVRSQAKMQGFLVHAYSNKYPEGLDKIVNEEGNYLTIEFAGILNNSINKDLANKFLKFMLSEEFQSVIPSQHQSIHHLHYQNIYQFRRDKIYLKIQKYHQTYN